MAQSKSGLNWGLPDSPLPTTAAPTPTAAPAGATATTPNVSPQATPTPSASDFILQHLGQGGIGSADRIAPTRPDSWWDVVPGTKGFGEPAQPGPQSWFDWFSKTYRPSAADVGTAYADDWSYGLSPLAAKGVQAGSGALGTGNPLPAALTPEAMRARIQQAHENVGPGEIPISAAAMVTQPLTYLGLNPISAKVGTGVGALAEKYLPATLAKYVAPAVTGGTATGLVSEAHTAGQGGGPMDYLRAAANIPVGAALSGVASSLPLGRSTPEDVVNRTAQAAQAANTDLANVKVPSKTVGFRVQSGPGATWQGDPTLADLANTRDFLQNQLKAQGFTPTAPSRSMFDKPLSPEDPGYRAPAPSDAGTGETANPVVHEMGRNISDILLQKLNAATNTPEAAVAQASAQAAAQRAQNAQALQRMWNRMGATDVRPDALRTMDQYPEGSAPQQAMGTIAGTPNPSPQLPRSIRSGLSVLGAGLGEAANVAAGGHVPWGGGAATGTAAANWLGNAFEDLRGGGSISPLVQRNIAKAYPTLTGQPAPGPGGNQALSNALLRLYGAGWFH